MIVSHHLAIEDNLPGEITDVANGVVAGDPLGPVSIDKAWRKLYSPQQ